MQLVVKTMWRDNNSNVAEMWFRPAVTDSYGGAMAIAMPILEACIAISDALLFRVEFEWQLEITPGVPGITSDNTVAATLFFRNGVNTSSLLVPSTRRDLAELAGEYAGKRITRESALLLNLLVAIESIPSGLLDPIGRPYGTEFIVGGYTAP